MITRQVPRDISAYETKLMLGLTTRQVCLFLPGAICAIAVYFLTKDSLGDLALFCAILTALPFLVLASFKPLGLRFEVFLLHVFLPMMMSPTNRRYKSENTYSQLLPTCSQVFNEELKKQNKGKKQKAKNTKSKYRQV